MSSAQAPGTAWLRAQVARLQARAATERDPHTNMAQDDLRTDYHIIVDRDNRKHGRSVRTPSRGRRAYGGARVHIHEVWPLLGGPGSYRDSSDTGLVPWYVADGVEFETEMAQGYTGYRLAGPDVTNSGVSTHELAEWEHEQLTATYPEELEDWDLSPMGQTVHAGGWVDQDWSMAEPVGDPFVEAFIEAAGNPAFRLFGSDGAPNMDRIRAWEDDYFAGLTRGVGGGRRRSATPKYVPEPVEGPTDGLTVGERALGPVPGDEAPVAPPLPSSATGGLPTADDGRIDPEAWKQAWS